MSASNKLLCFKTYDVRGKLGEELNDEIAYRIGRATAQVLNAKTVALGFDARETSPNLALAVSKGICDAGVDVLNIGLAGTEELYAAVATFHCEAGITITASHNPIDYNGMKIVKQSSQPLSGKEFSKIKKLAEENNFIESIRTGVIKNKKERARQAYIDKVISLIKLQSLKPLKIVVNSGNGAAGPTIDALVAKLEARGVKTNFVYIHHHPNSSFPNGIPNPLLEENRGATVEAVVREKADFGVAFDGDFDRCFLFDHQGNFIPGELVVGLLAEVFLRQEKGARIVYDPRVVWNIIDVVKNYGGIALASKTGHAFVKAAMREAGAVYGGELSAHHYFRDFHFCDSGMIPWLLVWQILSQTEMRLFEIISERKKRFPSSGELNFKVANPARCLSKIKDSFTKDAILIDELDGLSMIFKNWRFNLRKSNTEPLVRLNIETLGDQFLLEEKITEIVKFINKL